MAILCPGCRLTIRKELAKCPMCGADLTNAEDDPPSASTQISVDQVQVYSGFWRRAVALCIDSAIVSMIQVGVTMVWALIAVGSLIGSSNFGGGQFLGALAASLFALVLVSIAIGLAYSAFFESSTYRATPGKLIMQAYVADVSGAPLTFGRALGRNAAKLLSAIIFGIGYIMPAFTAKKQALHDMVASTLVLRKPDASPARFIAGVVLAVLLLGIQYAISGTNETARHGKINFKINGVSQDLKTSNNLPVPDVVESTEPAPTGESTPSLEPDLASPNFVSVFGTKYDFPYQAAFLKRNGAELLIGLYEKPVPAKEMAHLKEIASSSDISALQADIILDFKFARTNMECSATDLSSYVVTLRASPSGLKLPENRDSIEFARAITSDRSREGIALSCQKKNGSDLVVAMRGSGGKVPNETKPQYEWNLAFKTELIEVP